MPSQVDRDITDPSELGAVRPSLQYSSITNVGSASVPAHQMDFTDPNPPNQYLSSGAYKDYCNLANHLPGPYTTPWTYDAQSMWSKGLIEDRDINYNDAALLAFTVDCAMKLYIRLDVDQPASEVKGESDLAWSVILEVYAKVHENNALGRVSSDTGMACAESFFLLAMDGVMKFMERCTVILRQHIQDPINKYTMALYVTKRGSFVENKAISLRAFQWVYGIWPQPVVAVGLDEEDFTQNLMSIREWVFEYN